MKEKLDNNEIHIQIIGEDVDHLLPHSPNTNWSTTFFECVWAKRPVHGKTKGNTYMTQVHKDIIEKLFNNSEKDKVMKMSAALMFETMTKYEEEKHNGTHPYPKHYLRVN